METKAERMLFYFGVILNEKKKKLPEWITYRRQQDPKNKKQVNNK